MKKLLLMIIFVWFVAHFNTADEVATFLNTLSKENAKDAKIFHTHTTYKNDVYDVIYWKD